MRAGKIKEAPIFVTKDGYILDGHHRWAAKVAIDLDDGTLGDVEMPVDMIDIEIGEAIDLAMRRVRTADRSPLAGDNAALAFLVVAGTIARSHHERWDGAGYPDRLAAAAIPLPARIMAVADVYDALISPRIYKPALPHTEAVAIIRAGRGTQFDPGLVDMFEGLHERFAGIAMEYGDKG